MIDLPLDVTPDHVFVYDLLSGRQTEVSWGRLPDFGISVPVLMSAAPKLLIAR